MVKQNHPKIRPPSAGRSRPWQRRTNVWRKVTSPRKGEPRLRSGTNVPGPSRISSMNKSIDRLRCHFGLTLAEARLAFRLVAGETLRSAAVKLGISYETTRSSLKHIFRKTQTCRQAELVIVILTALPDCVEARAPALGRPRPRNEGLVNEYPVTAEKAPQP
jgi:DNA-binding CsgD family transcriptional regulator